MGRSVSHRQWSIGEKRMLILFLFKYRREMNPFQSLIDARLIDLEDAGGSGLQHERGEKMGLRAREVALPLRQEGMRAGLLELWRRNELWKDRILEEIPTDESGDGLEQHLRKMNKGAP